MTDYYIEERSGVIEVGPFAYYPDGYPNRTKPNWATLRPWLHLLILIIALPLIFWNLFLLISLINDANDPRIVVNTTVVYPSAQIQQQQQPATGQQASSPYERVSHVTYRPYHWLGFLIAFCAIFTYLFAGVLAFITELAGLSEKFAKLAFAVTYTTIAFSILLTLLAVNLNPIWIILICILLVLYGFGFSRFLIVSSYQLNEDGPLWFKPVLYLCLALIPLLSTMPQCKGRRHEFGCLPSDYWLGGRSLYVDYYSFTLMMIIVALSSIPFFLHCCKPQQKRVNQV